MVFSSILFLCVFLPVFLTAFYLSPHTYRKRIIVLFSFVFYAWGAPIFVFYLLLSTVIDYYLSHNYNIENQYRKRYLWVSILMNVLLLCYFKYANFFVENVSDVSNHLGFGTWQLSEIILPIGISFFTFQKISYTLDIYSQKEKPLSNFLDYMLYILMFPQLIAGPIVRFIDVSGQIRNYSSNALNQKLEGFFRFIIGLSKKVFIANTMALVVAQINDIGVSELSTLEAWIGALAYTFQIYFDFSGYSDMAIGLGLMIGFKFPENFNFPYLSKSITSFWKRWHITLGVWMREYLYIPLGGNRVSLMRVYINLIIVFFLSGIWHGANWNFVVWGLYHGLFLVLEKAFLGRILQKLPSILSISYSFIIVMIGWVLFSMDLNLALLYLSKMFDFSSFDINVYLSFKFYFFLILGFLFSFMAITKNIESKLNNIYTKVFAKSVYLSITIYLLSIVLLSLSILSLMTSDFNPFIYYRF